MGHKHELEKAHLMTEQRDKENDSLKQQIKTNRNLLMSMLTTVVELPEYIKLDVQVFLTPIITTEIGSAQG